MLLLIKYSITSTIFRRSVRICKQRGQRQKEEIRETNVGKEEFLGEGECSLYNKIEFIEEKNNKNKLNNNKKVNNENNKELNTLNNNENVHLLSKNQPNPINLTSQNPLKPFQV